MVKQNFIRSGIVSGSLISLLVDWYRFGVANFAFSRFGVVSTTPTVTPPLSPGETDPGATP